MDVAGVRCRSNIDGQHCTGTAFRAEPDARVFRSAASHRSMPCNSRRFSGVAGSTAIPMGELDRMSANKAANLSLIAHAEPEPTLSRLRGGLALIGLFQRGDVELDHLHHRLNSPLGAGGIGTAQILHQRGRHDLPRYAV